MKLHSVRIDGFAGLSRAAVRLDDGKACLLLVEDESGRQDWVRCVTALFYDFQTDDGAFDAAARAACAPTRAGPYACAIEFTAGAGRFRLNRDFAAGTVRLEQAGDAVEVSARWRSPATAVFDVGTRLLGIGRNDFLRLTGFPALTECTPETVETLRRELERALTSEEPAVPPAAARPALAQARDRYAAQFGPAFGVSGLWDDLIAELRRRVQGVEGELREASAAEAEFTRRAVDIERLTSRSAERSAALEAVGGAAVWAEFSQLERSLAAHREACDRLGRHLPERERLRQRAGFPSARREEFVRAAEQADAATRAAAELERRTGEIQDRLRESGLSADAGTATDAQLRDVPGLAERLDASRRRAVDLGLRVEAFPAAAGGAFAPSFAGLTADEQDLCRAAGPELRKLEAEREAARARGVDLAESLETARGAQRSRTWFGWAAAAAAGLPLPFLAAEWAGLWEGSGEPAIASAVRIALAGATAVTLAAAGATLLFLARRVRSAFVEPMGSDCARFDSEVRRLDHDISDVRERLRRPAARTGVGGTGELLSRIEAISLEPGGVQWLSTCREAAAAAVEQAKLDHDLRAVLSALGRSEAVEDVAAEQLRSWAPAAEAVLETRRLRARLREELETVRKELPVRWAGRQAARDSYSALLSVCGLDPHLDPTQSGSAFSAAAADAGRFHALDQELIPTAEADKLPEDEVVGRSRRLAECVINAKVRSALGVAEDATAAQCAAAASAVMEEAAALSQRVAAMKADAAPLRLNGPILAALLRRRLEAVGGELRRLEDLDAGLRTAAEALERSRIAVFTAAVEKLNALSSRIVPTLVPGYAGFRFAPDLSFALRRSDGRLVNAREFESLPAPNVRDRVWLAARLTVAEALAGLGETALEPVPLFVEEPPAADDARRSGAMLSLLGVTAGKRQVCILTSGRRKNENRLREDPAFRNRLQLARI